MTDVLTSLTCADSLTYAQDAQTTESRRDAMATENELPPLWRLAEDVAKLRAEPFERVWLKAIRAFWRGELAPSGLVLRQSIPGIKGIQTEGIFSRHELAEVALGQAEYARRGPDDSISFLLTWSRADYGGREVYSDWFLGKQEDCGLCLVRREWSSWARGAGLDPIDGDTLDKLKDDMRGGRALKYEVRARAAILDTKPWEITWEPDPVRFDPMTEPYWTMAMTVSWIVWRTSDSVQLAWPKWCAEAWRTKWGDDRRNDDGYALEQLESRTIGGLSIDVVWSSTVDERPITCTVPHACEALAEQLAIGSLVADGVKGRGGTANLIEPREWARLKLTFGADGHERFSADKLTGDEGYRDLLFRRAEVMAIWTPILPVVHDSAVAPVAPAKPAFSEAKVRAALNGWIAPLIVAGKRATVSEGHAAMRQLFPGLSRDPFAEIWRDVVPVGWRTRGRRKQSLKPNQ